MEHRFFDNIETQFSNKGESFFILHGRSLSEDCFYNHVSRCSMFRIESLAANLLYKNKTLCDAVIVVSKKDTRIYTRQEQKDGWVDRSSFDIQTTTNPLDIRRQISTEQASNTHGGARRPTRRNNPSTSESSEQIQQNVDDAIGGDFNPTLGAIREITRALRNERVVRTAFVIDGLEQIATLYEGQDHNLEIVEEVKEMQSVDSSSHNLSIVLVDKTDILSNYIWVLNSDEHVIHVGGPSVDEIQNSLTLVLVHLQSNRISRDLEVNLQLLDHEMLKSLSSALKNKGYNLKNAMYFFHGFVTGTLSKKGFNTDSLKERFFRILNVSFDDANWKDIFLPRGTEAKILRLFRKFLKSETLKNQKKGMLLYGPPGTGKTEIARALANFGGCYFKPCKLADFKGSYVGHSGKNVESIFLDARSSAPTVIFIDEIDSIFQIRGGRNQDGFSVDIINQFLAETDGIDTGRQKVFIIATTNRMDIVDPAVRSRLEPIDIGLPDADAIEKMFRLRLHDNISDGDITDEDINLLRKKTIGFSGRDITGLSNNIIQHIHDRSPHPIEDALVQQRRYLKDQLTSSYFKVELNTDMNESQIRTQTIEQQRLMIEQQNIIGYWELKNKSIESIRSVIQDYERCQNMGLEPVNGVLLHGPPGNGKTTLAESIAKVFGLDFLLVTSREFATFASDAIQRLDEVFNNIARMAVMKPIMVFFDEWDALANNQISPQERGAILKGLDFLRSKRDIVMFAATNHRNRLDPGIIRHGRFDVHFRVPNPSAEDAAHLIRVFCSKGGQFTLGTTQEEITAFIEHYLTWTDEEANLLAQNGRREDCEYSRYSVSQIKLLSDWAKRKAYVHDNSSVITTKHLEEAISEI